MLTGHRKLSHPTMTGVSMPPPNILHIMQCANLGGMEKSTLELMSAERILGCENWLISLNPIGRLGPLLVEREIPARGLRYRGLAGALSIPEMTRAFREGDTPDAVVMTGQNMAAFAALAGHRCKKRILRLHNCHKGFKSRLQWQAVYAAAMRIFPHIAFCSDFIREEAEQIYPPLRRVSVTQPDCVNLSPLPSREDKVAARLRLGIPEDSLVVGNAGRLIGFKRWDVFLQTAARILAKEPRAVFLIGGDGPMRPELRELSHALGLESRVRWLGWQKDLKDFYLSLNVLLFSSDGDAVGLSPLEAAGFGVPMVASILYGGLQEIIDSEKLGFLSCRHDLDWLAEKAILLLRNPALGGEMAAACRRVVADRNDPVRNATRILKLLELEVPIGQAA